MLLLDGSSFCFLLLIQASCTPCIIARYSVARSQTGSCRPCSFLNSISSFMCAHTTLRHEGNFILSFTKPRVLHLRHLHCLPSIGTSFSWFPHGGTSPFSMYFRFFFCDTLINEPFSQPDTGVSRALPATDHGSAITFQFPLQIVPAKVFSYSLQSPCSTTATLERFRAEEMTLLSRAVSGYCPTSKVKSKHQTVCCEREGGRQGTTASFGSTGVQDVTLYSATCCSNCEHTNALH